tara:strand:+ start:36 stop:599 length:564 start_codon:yes stop_codon:yes gene_type:complete
MNDLTEKLTHDPFLGSSIPGQSLTSEPGRMPYENPPMTSSPYDAYLALKAGMYQPDTQKDITEMALAGLTCETIATSFVMIGFSKGMFNPDVAELIKPFLAVEAFKIAKENGVQDVALENSSRPADATDVSALRELKEDLAPDNKLKRDMIDQEEYDRETDKISELLSNMDQPEDNQGFMTRPQGVE